MSQISDKFWQWWLSLPNDVRLRLRDYAKKGAEHETAS